MKKHMNSMNNCDKIIFVLNILLEFNNRTTVPINKYLRTEVRGDFNIHGTKNFHNAVFHQKSKNYDVLSLLYLWLATKTCSPREILTWLVTY